MRRDEDRLLDILEAIERIRRHTARGREAFDADELIQTWVVHHLQIIGEAASRLSDQAKHATPQVSWRSIVGMRNVLVHGYFAIDLEAAWTVVERDLASLESAIRHYVELQEAGGPRGRNSPVEVDPADRFHQDMVSGIDRLKREIDYRPTRFAQMVNEQGGVNAAKRLLASDQYSEGFTTLWEKGRLEWSVEAFVLLPWYRELFTASERATAERRLRDHRFDVERFLREAESNPPEWAS